MTIRRNIIYLFLFVACLRLASAAWAQPNGFSAVTAEKVAELESMHQQAIDFLIRNDFQGAVRTYSDILLMEPDDETAYTGLGQIYLVQGRYKLANEAFKNALNINGDNQVALAGIRRIMDPDGTEGMVSKSEIESEPYLAAPQAGMAKRVQSGPPAPRKGSLALLHAQRAQMALRIAGFYHGPVNGMVDSATKASIREFQKNFGLVSSGRLTSATLARLSEYLSRN